VSDACFCDFDPAEFYFVTTPVARKAYRCYECNGHIKPGEKYERVFASWDGDKQTVRTCSRCLDLREYVKAHVPCFCLMHGSLHDDAIETARHYAHEAPGLLFGAWRRKVIADKSKGDTHAHR